MSERYCFCFLSGAPKLVDRFCPKCMVPREGDESPSNEPQELPSEADESE
jgi:hypothetical protein